MDRFYIIFIIRWLANSLGIWIAIQLLGSGYNDININYSTTAVLLAGLIFSLVNSLLKPLAVVLSLPAILLTLGLFMIIVNGFMVYISMKLAPNIEMSLLNSIYTGMILSLVNYIISASLLVKSNRLN